MKRKILVMVLSFILAGAASAYSNRTRVNVPKIQLAILLDTSSSMDGLINQAKSQLWKIVNEMALAEKGGVRPELEVSLYEYGNNNIAAGEGYIRMVLPFTGDLDSISSALFNLTTNGGDEYCGMVIGSAVRNLTWDRDEGNLKIIFIAGNEPFNQGSEGYTNAVRQAVSRGIVVNTIYCGSRSDGISTFWKHGADLAGGRYMNIDQDKTPVTIMAPQDAEIARLGEELNRTYIAYGKRGSARRKEQEKQDSNAMAMSEEAAVERSVSKASGHYSNSGWDLVDAVSGGLSVKDIRDEELPSEMRGMSKNEREKYIKEMSIKREKIKERINKLNAERRVYVEKKLKESGEENTLDRAIIGAVRESAGKKGFFFK